MPSGFITSHIDVAQLILYAFFIFFFGLIVYLQRESKREGYPLDTEPAGRAPHVPILGFPEPPPPKRFRMPHGEDDLFAPPAGPMVPPRIDGVIDTDRALYGYPLQPSGDPMRDGVGPASYPLRRDIPDRTIHGDPKIAPMRTLPEYQIIDGDPDPRGMPVVAADGITAGVVEDVWVDRAEPRILYFEVALASPAGAADDTESETTDSTDSSNKTSDKSGDAEAIAAQHVLLPAGFAKVQMRHNRIKVASIMAPHFQTVPTCATADCITRLEEDRITAYFASGHLYADARRQESRL